MPSSQLKTGRPLPSMATPRTKASAVAVACLPSSGCLSPSRAVPVPATVVITWVLASTRRRLPWPKSAMKTLPSASTATASGRSMKASAAGPPSPRSRALSLPAKVVILPVAASTRRTRWPSRSAISRLPSARRAAPLGKESATALASRPSPTSDWPAISSLRTTSTWAPKAVSAVFSWSTLGTSTSGRKFWRSGAVAKAVSALARVVASTSPGSFCSTATGSF